ncbi:MAG TPA: hypothetical protein VGQ97_03850 [Xanthobacteraceae bacterium]|nr:hypothetical protein [Xanthobacteraceae bacterium]
MRKLAIAFAAAAALLAGPALAGPVSGKAPATVNPLTEAQFSIEVGPQHERWRSRRDEHRRWESRGGREGREGRENRDRRCKTVTVHRSETSRSKTIRECRD